MIYAIFGVLFILADQLLKYYSALNLDLNTGIQELIPGFLRLTRVHNMGILYDYLQDISWLRWALLGVLTVFSAIIITLMCTDRIRSGFARFTATMMLAGLLTNGIDRVCFGYVVDMLEPEFMDFAIFNIGDILAILGGILFCLSVLFGKRKEDTDNEPGTVTEKKSKSVTSSFDDDLDADAPVKPASVKKAPAKKPSAPSAEKAKAPVKKAAAPTAGKPKAPVKKESASVAEKPTAPVKKAGTTAEKPKAPVKKAPAPAPEKPKAPVKKPAAEEAVPVEKAAEDEFSLDSILAEFNFDE